MSGAAINNSGLVDFFAVNFSFPLREGMPATVRNRTPSVTDRTDEMYEDSWHKKCSRCNSLRMIHTRGGHEYIFEVFHAQK